MNGASCPKLSAAETAAFWAQVDKTGECWEWTGQRNGPHDSSYGLFTIYRDGRRIRLMAHRVALHLTIGRRQRILFACHHCDNPPCVRPSHIYAGSAQSNSDDMHARGRAPSLLGSTRPDTTRRWTLDLIGRGIRPALETSEELAFYLTEDALSASDEVRTYIERLGGRLPELVPA